jgi:hypothetical protein
LQANHTTVKCGVTQHMTYLASLPQGYSGQFGPGVSPKLCS